MGKYNYGRIWAAAYNGEKLPRKAKKMIFGKHVSKTKIKLAIAELQFMDDGELAVGGFCPKCGCTMERGTGNMAEYPEHWEDFYCIRCNTLVGSIDNSRYMHVLENNGYHIKK